MCPDAEDDKAAALPAIRVFVMASTCMAASSIESYLERQAPFAVVGGCTWERLDDAEAILLKERPDVIYVLDGPGPGRYVSFFERMADILPSLKVIIQLSHQSGNQELQFMACQLVKGFLYPDENADQLLKAARAVMRNKHWLRRSVYDLYMMHRPHPLGGPPQLTPRERQIAQQAGSGISNREIAEKLYISEATVKLHLNKIYRKLGVKNRTQLSRLSIGYED